MHGHARSGSNVGRRPQNAKAAAQRLAQVMACQQADDDDEEDELYEYNPVAPSTAISLAGGRPNRSTRTPLSVRTSIEPKASTTRPASQGIRPSTSTDSLDQQPLQKTVRTSLEANASATRPASIRTSVEPVTTCPGSVQGIRPSSSSESLDQQPLSARSTTPIRISLPVLSKLAFQSKNTLEQPPSARAPTTPLAANQSSAHEQPLSARSLAPNRSGHFAVKPLPVVPSNMPLSLRPIPATEAQPEARKDKRLSVDFGTFKYKEPPIQPSSSALQDEWQGESRLFFACLIGIPPWDKFLIIFPSQPALPCMSFVSFYTFHPSRETRSPSLAALWKFCAIDSSSMSILGPSLDGIATCKLV
ncbi:uncharacterized protein LOC132042464 [Lycium ferocissimum]|uniref:uncharacterized protein LOC132042464 n=1 Tax=Lycium ferocissimum TaxID=112874 RepID=UPI002815DFFA|nr:uncharacterized protein LOC132042464 [Lycium ferocissimum]